MVKKEDGEDFGLAIFALGEMYNKALSKGVVRMYWDSLDRFELLDVSNALRRYTEGDNASFFPKPGDIIKLIEGDTGTRAQIAFDKVRRAIGSPGIYTTICFDDAIINKVVQDMGGWPALGTITNQDFKFYENRFIVNYRGIASMGEFTHPKFLIGSHDAANSQRFGTGKLDPVLVGDATQAREVYLLGGSPQANKPTLMAGFDPVKLLRRSK